jgi:hypothetical protein
MARRGEDRGEGDRRIKRRPVLEISLPKGPYGKKEARTSGNYLDFEVTPL